MSTFASAFTPVLAAQAEQAIQSGEKVVLFIGRSSCPYCQRFEPKLTQVAKATGMTVYYLNSELSTDLSDVQALRAQYGVPTVPGLLVAEGGQVKVVCDSSLSEEAITQFIS